jgi:hypothetical protein
MGAEFIKVGKGRVDDADFPLGVGLSPDAQRIRSLLLGFSPVVPGSPDRFAQCTRQVKPPHDRKTYRHPLTR